MQEKQDGRRLVVFMVLAMIALLLLLWWAGNQLPQTASDDAQLADNKALAVTTPTPATPTPNLKITPAPDEVSEVFAYENSASKKRFVEQLLPLIEAQNQQLLADRQKAQNLLAQELWTDSWLLDQLELYRTDVPEALVATLRQGVDEVSAADHAHLLEAGERLMLKLDVVPPSLALAQSANESAWGRSRFASEGNNYFGQWCFSEGCGIVPTGRPEGESYEVRSFDSVADSVRGYILNLNRHWAYERLRALRAQQRRLGEQITGVHLAGGLERYSARGFDYIDELRSMIWVNDFDKLDSTSSF